MEDRALIEDLRVAFEYTHVHDDWVTPLPEALADVTVEEALYQIADDDSEPIWRIVLHLAKWNENIVDRILQQDTSNPNEDRHWPALPLALDEDAWKAARQRLDDSITAIDSLLRSATLAQILESEYGLPDLLCRYTHMGYHIGQITKIRECYRLHAGLGQR